ncbi:hypothetical protein F0562_024755 [Nyssa sinensis]|uniref:Uncharacterized protein n=1 Tax=Nyssa sinensis TaxID=561372 RepID=A0A5J5BCV2_9ASTE|nr:hypothetical protein F0562_024755 [Nyssa sinensis]
MADSLVSIVLRQLVSLIQAEVQQEVRLVAGARKEVEKLRATLTGIRAALNDAERKQVKEKSVRVWLEEVKDITYELDDVLDEWNTRILGSKIEGIQKWKNVKERLDLVASEKDKALDLSQTVIEELPSEIGKLLHLRYLDLSSLDLGELPDAVSNLYNLQTLNLNWCQLLHKLPKGVGKLTNLRHLNMECTDWLSIFPRGIGRLSSLRTLSKFVVSCNREGCRIEELNKLNHLRGHLEISGLENVTDADEARKADLMNKNHLRSLDLVFSFGERKAMEGVIEALEPHPNLEGLQVYDYGGSIFPTWIMMLTNLKDLRLLKCESCDLLPPLGKLPSLEKLLIGHMNSVKNVGLEFLGIEVDGDSGNGNGMRNNDGTVSLAIFPKLKELTFRFMVKWEGWDATIATTTTIAGTSASSDIGGTDSGGDGDGDASARNGTGNEASSGTGNDGDTCVSSGIVSGADGHTSNTTRIMMMPSLHSLSFYDCPNLEALPQCLVMIPLKKLIIRRCPVLEQRCQIRTGQDWSKISHIPDIQI